MPLVLLRTLSSQLMQMVVYITSILQVASNSTKSKKSINNSSLVITSRMAMSSSPQVLKKKLKSMMNRLVKKNWCLCRVLMVSLVTIIVFSVLSSAKRKTVWLFLEAGTKQLKSGMCAQATLFEISVAHLFVAIQSICMMAIFFLDLITIQINYSFGNFQLVSFARKSRYRLHLKNSPDTQHVKYIPPNSWRQQETW